MIRRDFIKAAMAGLGTFAISKSVNALEYIAAASSKKIAVIYSTWCGSTKDAAGWIAEGMGGTTKVDILDVKDNPNVGNYESIVLGSAIRQATISPDMKTFVQTNKDALKNRLKGLFAVCGNNGSTTISDATKKKYTTDSNGMGGLCGVTNAPSMVFPGRINQCTKDAGITAAEYDHLKQTDCVDFGKTLLPTLVKSTQNALPTNFELRQNYPNPANPVTIITYSIPQTSNVLLTISAVNGRKLATLVSGRQEAGYHKAMWDGSRLPAGKYIYRLQAGNFSATREAKLVR
jgi:flavodoxin